jgi:hypothetical protein
VNWVPDGARVLAAAATIGILQQRTVRRSEVATA